MLLFVVFVVVSFEIFGGSAEMMRPSARHDTVADALHVARCTR